MRARVASQRAPPTSGLPGHANVCAVSAPVRRPPDGAPNLPSHPGSAAPPRTRRLKKRHHTGLIVVALIIGFSIYASNRSHHYHPTPVQQDKSDLSVVPAAVSIRPGGTGNVSIRLANTGPDDLDHNVTFTITTSDRLALTGPGEVLENGVDDRFFPDSDCKISSPRLMRCESFVTVSVGRQVVWTVPVRVALGTPTGTSESLTVTAVGNTLYTDPNTGNNRDIAYPVSVGRPGAHGSGRPTEPSGPVASTPPPSPTPTATPPSVPGRTVGGSATKPHTPASKSIRNAARDALVRVSIVVAIVLGLALLIVIALAFVARQQRKQPLNYMPPPRE